MTYYHLIPEQPLPPPLPPPPRPRGQNPVPIVYYAAPTIAYNFVPHYDKDASGSLGSTQILLACISIAAGVMAILYGAGCYEVGIGIWAGIWYIIAGSYAFAARNDPTNSVITAPLVFSVFDILFGVTQLTITSIGIKNELDCYGDYFPYYSNYSGTCVEWWKAAVAANSMMIGVGSLEIIIGVLLTAISSRAISEGSKPRFAYFATIPVTFTPNQQEPVFIQGPSPRPPSAHQSQLPPSYDLIQRLSTSNQPEPAFVHRPNQPERAFVQRPNQPEPAFVQRPNPPLAHQSQLPPSYDLIQHSSTSNQPERAFVQRPNPPLAHLSQPSPSYDQLQHSLTSNQPERAFVQRPNPPLAHLSQPPPSYDQLQHSLTSNQRQMMYVGVQQDPWKPIRETSL